MRVLLIALLIAATPGCRPRRPVTRDECDRLLDRYAEMLLRADQPRLAASGLARAKEEARARAARSRPFLACSSEVSREQMDCALASFNPDEIERCLVPMP